MILLYQHNKMSKTDKLDRMKNTVLETTGLTYTPGGTIELNFTPDVTDTGVSVPLVIGGSSSVTVDTDLTNYPNLGGPISGCPYAQIVDQKPKNVNGGPFYQYNNSTTDRKYTGDNIGGTSFYWRVRDIQTIIIDEIGVSGPYPATNVSGNSAGNYFSLPVGTYQVDLSMVSFRVNNSIGIIYNHTKSEVLTATFVNSFTNQHLYYGSADTNIRGRFKITNPDDKIIVLHANDYSFPSYGFGIQNEGNLGDVFGNIYLTLELWKIR